MLSRNSLIYLAAFAVLIAGSFSVTLFLLNSQPQDVYSVENGILSYTNRPPVTFGQEVWNQTQDTIIYRVWYPSHGNATIFGLLSMPKVSGPMPAFFILPGATVTKEGEQRLLGEALNELGYAALSLDQRGHGETASNGNAPFVLSFEDDFPLWASGLESQQHMWAYDGLRAFDLLNQIPGIDRSRIYAAGESLGGNYAMIDAGIEPRIAGLLLISSSGFKFNPQNDPRAAAYMKSVVGDSYLPLLSPRPLAMIQAEDDRIVSLNAARDSYEKAMQPKTLITVPGETHSYHDDMKESLEEAVRFLEEN